MVKEARERLEKYTCNTWAIQTSCETINILLETEQQLKKTSFQFKQSSKDRERWEMFAEKRLWKIMEIRQRTDG